ncbi:MAG: acyl-CoA dehydrogenase [Marinobacter sp.]|nr:acyl-CoA dehydrogenase [Marinobacter sp.]
MDFSLTDEQQMLQDTTERLLRETYPFDVREAARQTDAGFSTTLWQQLGELGLTAVPFDEPWGGFSGQGLEVHLVMKALGRSLSLEPYLQSVVMAGGLISAAGSPEQQDQWLPKIASASTVLTVAALEPHSHYDPHAIETLAERTPSGWCLQGRKSVVVAGHCADAIILNAMTDAGPALFIVPTDSRGLTRRSYPTVDGRKGCDLFLDGVSLPASALLGTPGDGQPVLDYQLGRGIAGLCAEAVGAMEVATELTLDYLKTRRQFGVPIGKFQVLQHRMVDMCSELEQARSMALLAASVADSPASETRQQALHAAKVVVGRAGQMIAEQAIQLHGGIGMTWEYSLSHYAKRLVMINHELGDDDYHLDRYAALM